MKTHIKDATATVIAFVAMIATVHAGIWFSIFGVPDITVLNWPFHYFWFVVGALISLFLIFTLYHRYATILDAEKEQLTENHGRESRRRTDSIEPGEGDD
jgi:uncharacterized membrane protein YedE/YeeE